LNRKLTRTVDLKRFAVEGTENIYINENLTKFRKRLFWNAKRKAKANGYQFYWTVNGNVLVRKSDDSAAFLIKDEGALALIK